MTHPSLVLPPDLLAHPDVARAQALLHQLRACATYEGAVRIVLSALLPSDQTGSPAIFFHRVGGAPATGVYITSNPPLSTLLPQLQADPVSAPVEAPYIYAAMAFLQDFVTETGSAESSLLSSTLN